MDAGKKASRGNQIIGTLACIGKAIVNIVGIGSIGSLLALAAYLFVEGATMTQWFRALGLWEQYKYAGLVVVLMAVAIFYIAISIVKINKERAIWQRCLGFIAVILLGLTISFLAACGLMAIMKKLLILPSAPCSIPATGYQSDAQVIDRYFCLVNSHMLDEAWNILSPGFQNDWHENNKKGYIDYWFPREVKLRLFNCGDGKVEAIRETYLRGDPPELEGRDFERFTTDEDTWLIHDVVYLETLSGCEEYESIYADD